MRTRSVIRSTFLVFRIIKFGAKKHFSGKATLDLEDESALADLAEKLDVSFKPTGDAEDPLSIWLEGDNVTRDVRTDEAGMDASKVAPMASVREAIGLLQRSFKQAPGLVADGRDMGTVVFPDADAKIYLTASAEARAERRYKQLKDKDISVSLHALFTSIRERDERDMTRKVAPLIPASAAAIIDSTSLSIDEVFDQVLAIVTGRLD